LGAKTSRGAEIVAKTILEGNYNRDVGLQPKRGKAGIEKGCRPVVRLSLGFILRSMT